MYPEGFHTISIKDQVKSDFLALVDFLSTRLSFPWWFALKEDARNRHSLARAIGITRDELLMLSLYKSKKCIKTWMEKHITHFFRNVQALPNSMKAFCHCVY
jgi:hypothetical protein